MRNISLFLYIIPIALLLQPTDIKCAVTEQLITNQSWSDGFGAQFRMIIGCVIYAELHGIKFVYTPFKTMEHNYDKDPDFLAKKEWLINFIGNFELNKTNNTPVPSDLRFFYPESEINGITAANSQSLKRIREIFRTNKDINHYFNNKNLNIAVHIRRPNPHDNRIDGTDTPDHVFLNIINELRTIYRSKKPLFHIYSQGNKQKFNAFEAPDIILHLDESLEDSFTAMVLADVLVTSRSTLSFVAGLLSNGTIYHMTYQPCPFLPNWISTDKFLK